MQVTWLGQVIPDRAGKIVAMCSYRDRILVACEYGLYEIIEDFYSGERRASEMRIDPTAGES